MITHTHNMSLAVAAVIVSIVAATTGMALMNNIRLLPESRRKAVIVMAAFLIGSGIWSMHFLAMLSIQFPVPIHYDLLQTLGSGLIAVLVVGFALLLLHFRPRTLLVLNIAGLCLGVGIVSMHVVGMLGMRGVIPEFNMTALSVSIILAMVMGVATVRVTYGSRTQRNIIKGGVLFGFSVVVVHYTAMIGTHFLTDPNYQALDIALNQGALAIVVTLTVFVICGTFLLAAATFAPAAELASQENNASGVEHANEDSGNPTPDNSAFKASISQPGQLPRSPVADKAETSSPETAAQQVAVPSGHSLPVKIPYEQQKQIFFIESEAVGAIRADGRYTQLYTRDGVKFCPWSITEAEKRLASVRFYRSHRSYLINMPAVASFEKQRDSGVCRFEGFTQLSNVPVSRSRVSELVSEMGL